MIVDWINKINVIIFTIFCTHPNNLIKKKTTKQQQNSIIKFYFSRLFPNKHSRMMVRWFKTQQPKALHKSMD